MNPNDVKKFISTQNVVGFDQVKLLHLYASVTYENASEIQQEAEDIVGYTMDKNYKSIHARLASLELFLDCWILVSIIVAMC